MSTGALCGPLPVGHPKNTGVAPDDRESRSDLLASTSFSLGVPHVTDLQQFIAVLAAFAALVFLIIWIDPDDMGGNIKTPGGLDVGLHLKRNGRRRPIRRRKKS